MPHSLRGSKSPYRTNRAFKYFRNLSSDSSWIPFKDSDGILGTDRIVRQHRHKCSRTEIKQFIFDKSHISWECFGNIVLEMTKSRFHPKSHIQRNYLESPEESQVSCQTVGHCASIQPLQEFPFKAHFINLQELWAGWRAPLIWRGFSLSR